jgi:hypothetical protein
MATAIRASYTYNCVKMGTAFRGLRRAGVARLSIGVLVGTKGAGALNQNALPKFANIVRAARVYSTQAENPFEEFVSDENNKMFCYQVFCVNFHFLLRDTCHMLICTYEARMMHLGYIYA